MKVITIGLGYIGLPTSALIASKGVEVLGVDINQNVVDTINRGDIHIVEPELDTIVKKAVDSGFLKAATVPEVGNVYLIVVPTPINSNMEPDISFIESATKSIIPILKEGDLYIIESTSPTGTTEIMADLIFNERPELNGKIYLAYCPERVLPGNVMFELVNNDRVIGGINELSTQKAIEFYSQIVKGNLYSTDSRTAEMCKLVENSSRDVQIAFANELDRICDKAGIDTLELIRLANKHPRVNILKPGCGVGGHCIAVDPYFIISKFPNQSDIIKTARKINNYKPEWCIEKIKNTLSDFELINGRAAKIAIMGLAFKPNIDDLRESPAKKIAHKIKDIVTPQLFSVAEPNILRHKDFELMDCYEIVDTADVIVFLVAHDQFKELKIGKDKTILDFCGIRN